jgi:hypothetical protein
MWNISNAERLIAMFSGSKSFNKNLCAWGAQLAVSTKAIETRGMFVASACLDTRDPDSTNWTAGPYCHVCE